MQPAGPKAGGAVISGSAIAVIGIASEAGVGGVSEVAAATGATAVAPPEICGGLGRSGLLWR